MFIDILINDILENGMKSNLNYHVRDNAEITFLLCSLLLI